MPDLLDRIQAELHERLTESRDAVQEYRRLEAALAALDDSANPVTSGRARRRSSGRPRRAGGRRRRAPRGANREAVLRVVGERPGITTSELAASTGVEKRTLYTLLSSLVKQEHLEREQLPSGQTGYRVLGEAGTGTDEAAQPSGDRSTASA